MKKLITRSYIIQWRKIDRTQWHDLEWHRFMASSCADAVACAEGKKEPGWGYRDIQREAEKYLASMA